MPQIHDAVLVKYCFECHDSLSEKGGINLEELSFQLDSVASAELWQKVLNVMNSGEMPPEDQPQLSDAEKTDFLADLSEQIVIAREALSDTGGVTTMRRLNRREYENTIYDLLGVRVDASDLPDDANSGGFDTTGSALFFSSDQFEQYLKIGRKALTEAFQFGKQPERKQYRRESEAMTNPRFTRISGKLKTDFDEAQKWRATKGKKEPKAFGFLDENDVRFHERLYNQQFATYERYLKNPLTKSGVTLNQLFNGAMVDSIEVSKKMARRDVFGPGESRGPAGVGAS